MREISPAKNMTADEFLQISPSDARVRTVQMRCEKAAGIRPRPSVALIDHSQLLTKDLRAALLDHVALLVDENLFGRAEMCPQL